MKRKTPTALCVLIALVLVVFGVVYGTWSGYREDRAQVEELLTMENGLLDVLDYRAADGLNLCVVAGRHLPQTDEKLTALRGASETLRQAAGFSAQLDEQLGAAVSAVAEALRQNASFQQSARDQRYLDMLLADLSSLRGSEIVSAYNRAAEEFNRRLDQPLLGALAGWMGIEPCPVYR